MRDRVELSSKQFPDVPLGTRWGFGINLPARVGPENSGPAEVYASLSGGDPRDPRGPRDVSDVS